jgi:hypothetical protein
LFSFIKTKTDEVKMEMEEEKKNCEDCGMETLDLLHVSIRVYKSISYKKWLCPVCRKKLENEGRLL